jgi:trimeric autotransporter adhesin
MNMRATGAAALLAAAGLVSGLLTGAPAAVAAGPAGTAATGEPAGTITTVAGGLGAGPARNVFQQPVGLAAAPGGALYVIDGIYNVVRKFSSADSHESVVAGSTSPIGGYYGDGGPATAAGLFGPSGLAVDTSGNVLIADTYDNRIRVVARSTGMFYGVAMKAGYIYTVAGTGKTGFSGDGGPATSAKLNNPADVAVDAAGNLVIADSGNYRARVVAEKTGTFYGQAMTAGDIYTVAGDGTRGDTGNGGPATAAEVAPWSATVDAAGNLVIDDADNNVIRVVAEQTGTFYGVAMTAGDIYTVAGTGQTGFSGDGGPATKAELYAPSDAAVDAAGNLVIADTGNLRVRVVAVTTGTFYGRAMTAGDIYTVAGDGARGIARSGGLAASTSLSQPQAATLDGAGNLVIADNGYDRVWVAAAKTGRFYGQAMTAGHIYIVAGDGTLVTSGSGGKATNAECCSSSPGSDIAAAGSNYVVVGDDQAWLAPSRAGTYFGRAMTAGDIYVVAGNGFNGYNGDGRIATSARFNQPEGVAVDAAGNLVIADTRNGRVRVVAARSGTFYGQAMTVDHVYTVAGNGTFGYSGDGGPATKAEFFFARGVAVDKAGNLVIADSGNHRLRVVAATTGTFYGVPMKAGHIYTVAGTGKTGSSGDGGPAAKAGLTPWGVAVDAAGNLVVSAPWSNRIRVVAATSGTFYGVAMTAGDIYTVAGTGKAGYSGDGGPATAAEIDYPVGVAVDGAGNLVIADGNNRIRVVAAATGTFYGVAMTAGDIYTVAGNGKLGFSGDGGPATKAEMAGPEGVAADRAGNLLINDSVNDRVRQVTG